MLNKTTISAWSIFIALLGVSLNMIFIPPYPGVAILGDENKEWLYNLRRIIGRISNIFVFIGTAGQFISLFI